MVYGCDLLVLCAECGSTVPDQNTLGQRCQTHFASYLVFTEVRRTPLKIGYIASLSKFAQICPLFITFGIVDTPDCLAFILKSIVYTCRYIRISTVIFYILNDLKRSTLVVDFSVLQLREGVKLDYKQLSSFSGWLTLFTSPWCKM